MPFKSVKSVGKAGFLGAKRVFGIRREQVRVENRNPLSAPRERPDGDRAGRNVDHRDLFPPVE